MKKEFLTTLACSALVLTMAGCATPARRIDAGGTSSLVSTKVDLADFKMAAGELVQGMLTGPALANFANQNGRNPCINIGAIVNNSGLRIDLGQIAGRINEDLLNSGLVDVISNDAGAVFHAQNRPQADFLLEGVIMVLQASEGRMTENNYTFQIRLNETKTGMTRFQRSVDVGKQKKKALFGL